MKHAVATRVLHRAD